MKRQAEGLRAGFTALELLVGMTILSIGLLIAAESVGRAGTAYESSARKTHTEGELGRAMGRIVEVLSGVDTAVLQPDPTSELGVSDLGFRRPVEVTAAGVVFGPLDRLSLELEPTELDNGLDDDGDGLVDERELILLVDESGAANRTRLASGLRELAAGEVANGLDDDGDGLIDEPGFAVRREGNLLLVQLSAQVEQGPADLSAGAVPLEVELTTRIRVRN